MILPSFRRMEISNLSSGFMEGLPALRMSFSQFAASRIGTWTVCHCSTDCRRQGGRRARYDLAAMLALANGTWPAHAFRLWPLDHYGCRYLENPAIIFLQPPCYSTPLSSYSYFCRSSCRSFFCWEGSASRCSP